ncbi:Gamma-glutamyl:cysteine ligase YbdK, ATP-grasp superfamily [Halogranum amylolyticum]|uniref:Gamma-glutamyl:cysteine ligase YbdK, ATP-grasp superfamily n=1 Tax=Halogranum amylolyticum TaxID=660520 RepID=A0A1H8MSN7_9EURY|nr:hypothetical protein [Halogranum amylolyticum]SEO20254.1 Gamma-glutamyl:cysteine ligase YbdK, ATP-grasp superfamily [Halogranum amylolyticum]
MDWVDTVRRTRKAAIHDEFDRRVSSQAASLREALAAGNFDGEFTLGLELEGYAVDTDGRLVTIPDAVFETGCQRELGQHNAEVNTPATTFDPAGITEQARSLNERVGILRDELADYDYRFVTDGMWTLGPPQGALAYLTAAHEVAGQQIPSNLSSAARYYALDADITAGGPVELSLPGCQRTFSSILVESLATSMQVHIQPPMGEFAQYFTLAVRTLGPMLALAANAPFLPPSLYTDPAPETVLDAGVELRVAVFESMNVREPGKVRLPADIEHPVDAVDCIVADRRCAPYLREWVEDGPREGFIDDHWEFLHKQGTFWRWVRPVFGPTGPRLEYRVLAAQPSTEGVIAFQALLAGVLHGLVVTDHPLAELPWEVTHDSFYAAARDGFDATLAWVTQAGERTNDPRVIYPELFDIARVGLRDRGFETERINELVGPLEERWATQTSPSVWKREQVRDRLDDGTALSTAIEAMQRAYIERCCVNDPFAEWEATHD